MFRKLTTIAGGLGLLFAVAIVSPTKGPDERQATEHTEPVGQTETAPEYYAYRSAIRDLPAQH